MKSAKEAAGVDIRASTTRGVALRSNARDTAPQRQPRYADSPWGNLRRERQWSLRQLAARSGVHIADLSKIERGIGIATPDQARAILAAYDL